MVTAVLADQSIYGTRNGACSRLQIHSGGMSFTDDIPDNTSGQSVDDMETIKILEGGEDPILLTKIAREYGEKKQLQCNKDLWPMITYLHTRLQAVVAEN